MADKTPLKPPPTPGRTDLRPILPPSPAKVRSSSPAESALLVVENYFAKAPGRKLFDYESGKFNPKGAALFELELSEQATKLREIRAQYGAEIRDNPSIRDTLNRLEAQIRQGQTIIALKKDGVPAVSLPSLTESEPPRSTAGFRRLLGLLRRHEPQKSVVSLERLTSRYEQYLKHFQDPQLAHAEFVKTLSEKNLMGNPKVMNFLESRYFEGDLHKNLDGNVIKKLAHPAREMLTTEHTFNTNMKHLLTLVDYQISKDPMNAAQYQSLQKQLVEIFRESSALLSDLQGIANAKESQDIVRGVMAIDPARINRIQDACGRYSLNYPEYVRIIDLTLKAFSNVNMPKDVSESYGKVNGAGAMAIAILPIQRIGRYPLLTHEMAKSFRESQEFDMASVHVHNLSNKSKIGAADANNMEPTTPSSAPAYESTNRKGI